MHRGRLKVILYRLRAPILLRCCTYALSFVATAPADVYFVSSGGTDSSGTTCCRPMGIERAFSRSDYPAGSVVYVLRGQYRKRDGSGYQLSVGSSNVSFVGVTEFFCNSCTSSATPAPPPLPPLDEGEGLTSLHYDKYPVLKGDSVTDRASSTAVRIVARSGVTIRGLFILNYQTGITMYGSGSDNRIEQCIIKDLGYPFYGGNTGYSGKAILLGNYGSTAGQCYVENAGAEGIGINGSNMVITNCRVVGRDSEPGLSQAAYDNGTDYYFRMDHGPTDPCVGNRIEYCIAERIFEGGHSGKAFTISGYSAMDEYATDNDIWRCTAVNSGSSLTMRHSQCYGNRISECTIKRGVAICLVDSAHDNLFNRITHLNGIHALLVNVPTGGNICGTVIANSVFECWRVLTCYTACNGPNGLVNTRLANCTFKALTGTTSCFQSLNGFGIDSLHAVNCIFDGFAALTAGTPGAFTNSALTNCLFYSAAGSGLSSDSFAAFAATAGCIDGVDPGFTDPANDVYELTAGSACIDNGADLSALYPTAPWTARVLDNGDVSGNARIQNGRIDIGAVEYVPPVRSRSHNRPVRSETGLFHGGAATGAPRMRGALNGSICVTNLAGRMVLHKAAHQGVHVVDLSEVAHGVYSAVLTTHSGAVHNVTPPVW